MIITHINQITQDWLTKALFDSKSSNYVVDVDIEDGRTVTSSIARLTLYYRHPTTLPKYLFLKIGGMNVEAGNCLREVAFYQNLAPQMDVLSSELVPCRYASYDNHTKCSNILLDDKNKTHYTHTAALPLTWPEYETVVDVLAKTHAFWWNKICSIEKSDLVTQGIIERVQQHFGNFVDFLGDRLSSERRYIIEKVFMDFPKLYYWRRESQMPLTLVHGDVHPWNFLFPSQAAYTVQIIDWPAWHVGIATTDLAHLIGLVSYPEHRHRYESRLLRYYQTRLNQYGVTISLADIETDYRLSLIRNIYWPIFLWSTGNIEPGVWWSIMEKAFAAFMDWDCMAVLRG